MEIEPTDDTNKAETIPFAKPDPAAKLFWLDDGREGGPPFYRPFLVKFEERAGTSLTFHFASVADARKIGGSHTIDLEDTNLVWKDKPSTIPVKDFKSTASETDHYWGFLFLDYFEIDKRPGMKADADSSGSGTGKYPKSG